jgi:hypothetical protein
MSIQWKRLLLKITVWLVIEIILNILGLDNLADYSEFVYEQEVLAASHGASVAIVMPPL